MSTLVAHIEKVINTKNLNLNGDTLPDLGDIKRAFQIKDIPLKDPADVSEDVSASAIFTEISSDLKQKMDDIKIYSNDQYTAEVEKLINEYFEVISNTPEWKKLLLNIKEKNRENFTRAVRTAFLFKIITDLRVADLISPQQSEYIRLICNTMVSENANVAAEQKQKLHDERLAGFKMKNIPSIEQIEKIISHLSSQRSEEEALIELIKNPSKAMEEIEERRKLILTALKENTEPQAKIANIYLLIVNDILRLKTQLSKDSFLKNKEKKGPKLLALESLASNLEILDPRKDNPLKVIEDLIVMTLENLSSKTRENLQECLISAFPNRAPEVTNKEASVSKKLLAGFTRMFSSAGKKAPAAPTLVPPKKVGGEGPKAL